MQIRLTSTLGEANKSSTISKFPAAVAICKAVL